MNREKEIMAIRPFIDAIDLSKEMTIFESFQNQTIRPILKLQSEILLAIFRGHMSKRSFNFSKLSTSERETFITNTIQKDLTLRNILVGTVLALMTTEEITKYYETESESRNRISKMIISRLIDLL